MNLTRSYSDYGSVGGRAWEERGSDWSNRLSSWLDVCRAPLFRWNTRCRRASERARWTWPSAKSIRRRYTVNSGRASAGASPVAGDEPLWADESMDPNRVHILLLDQCYEAAAMLFRISADSHALIARKENSFSYNWTLKSRQILHTLTALYASAYSDGIGYNTCITWLLTWRNI